MRAGLPLLSLIAVFLASAPALADSFKPDDTVAFDISAEDWVATKTAHVTLNVEAAVSAATAGTMRADMLKSIDEVADADWRLTGFNRSQDQTGLDRWSASFDARLPEKELGGLAESARKESKAGMQISVGAIDFTPSLEETEAVRAALRTQLYKEAEAQLAALNSALPDRGYRIAAISIDGAMPPAPPRLMRKMLIAAASAPGDAGGDMERSEKLTMTAHITYAAEPPAPAK